MKKLIISIISLIITGCGTDYTSMVKDGTFNDYKSTTVGRAFDAWKQCDMGVTWEAFETDNGTNIVEYNCRIYESKKQDARNIFSTVQNNFRGDEERFDKFLLDTGCALDKIYQIQNFENCNLNSDTYLRSLATTLNMTIQFTVNLDDSFETSYIGAGMGSYEINLIEYELGSFDDYINMVMSNDTLSQNSLDRMHFLLAKYVPDQELVSELAAQNYLE